MEKQPGRLILPAKTAGPEPLARAPEGSSISVLSLAGARSAVSANAVDDAVPRPRMQAGRMTARDIRAGL